MLMMKHSIGKLILEMMNRILGLKMWETEISTTLTVDQTWGCDGCRDKTYDACDFDSFLDGADRYVTIYQGGAVLLVW